MTTSATHPGGRSATWSMLLWAMAAQVFLALLVYRFGFGKIAVASLAAGLIGLLFLKPLSGLYLSLFVVFSGITWKYDIPAVVPGLALLTVLAWTSERLREGSFRFRVDGHYIFVFGLFFFHLASIYVSRYQIATFSQSLGMISPFIFYLIVVHLVVTRRDFMNTVHLVVVTMLASSLFGFYEAAEGLLGGKFGQIFRISGLSFDPNVFACTLVVVLPVALLHAMYGRRLSLRLFYFAVALCFIAGIVLSFSRGGAVSMMVVLAMLVWRERRRAVVWMLLATLIVLILAFAPAVFWERLETLRNLTGDASIQRRYYLFVHAVELFSQHPLTGIGVGNFMPHSIWVIPVPQVVHNMYMEVAVETGLFGLFCLLAAMYLPLRYFARAQRSFLDQGDAKSALTTEGLRIGLVGLLVAALFLSIQNFFVLWTVMALSVVTKKLTEDGRVSDR